MIELIVNPLILAFSLFLLASTSHFTIKSIEKLIGLSGLSEASVGFVILAVLTSTPEMTVALFAILQGEPGISVGDILGSNVFNMAAVLGILGMLGYLKTCCTDLLIELTDILLITTLIPLLLIISHFHIFDVASPVVGVILLGTFLINTYLMTKKRTPRVKANADKTVEKESLKKAITILLLGFVGVVIAARLVVYSGSNIALLLGVPPILIGAKVVAIGTSLPELTLDFAAVRRGRVQLAIGDVIGSNLTNLTLVLGLVLLVSPFAVDMTIFTEILPFLMITTVIFWRFLTRGGVSQVGGIVLTMTYILFQAVT
ncbi:MAG: sodium:calcium antiporter [Candidatus Bathyarchaeota archaeon]|nr:sodium:calcium antiporter [Candidatus Bathyarchaeota archaeon]MDH5746622.1 sodium:calcium antiporter [Candidatus Bathyarchaeota archaeon]